MIEQAQRTAMPAADDRNEPVAAIKTVRDAVFDVMRRFGMTTIFGNPGSTEIPFLTGLPPDIHFVLGLHEGSVVGMATGYALARREPALVNLHTAPGLGNAVNAIANARDMRVPLIVLVGQQDRRQLAYEPFLTGRALEKLAGEYPVWSSLPVRAQDVPGAVARAYNEAVAAQGPALVVIPMGDWTEPVDEYAAGWPERTLRSAVATSGELGELAEMIDRAASPALVVGRSDDCESWEAVIGLAERLACPVWQESFARAAGFPQDHRQFAGHLPWRRRQMRETLAPHDLVIAIGTSAFRLYILDDPGPMVHEGTRVAVLTDDPAEAHRSPCALAIVAPVASACAALLEEGGPRDGAPPSSLLQRPPAPPPPAAGDPLLPGHVYAALAERLPRESGIVEETPPSQPELSQRLPIRQPRGFVACGNGGLGFGVAGSVGLRMGSPDRPVVGVVGDGSSMYAIQALWSAAHYEVGVRLLVMANGRDAGMDNLARASGAPAAWPAVGSLGIAGMARCPGSPATNITTHDELLQTFDQVLPDLASRQEPLLIEVALA